MKRNPDVTSTTQLFQTIKRRGAIPAFRTSSAPTQGRAKNYPYWGTSEYEIGIGARGQLVQRQVRGATSDRRSYGLAVQDTLRAAAAHHGLVIRSVHGDLSEEQAQQIIDQLED